MKEHRLSPKQLTLKSSEIAWVFFPTEAGSEILSVNASEHSPVFPLGTSQLNQVLQMFWNLMNSSQRPELHLLIIYKAQLGYRGCIISFHKTACSETNLESGFDTAEVQDCNLTLFNIGFILSGCTQEAAREATACPDRRELNRDHSWFCFKGRVQAATPEAQVSEENALQASHHGFSD